MKTILVVDDEYAITDVLSSLLTDEGYRVVTAANGQDGLARLAEAQPQLVMVDLMMPLMDGQELFQRMRADPAYSALPIVMMSAACSPAMRQVFDGTEFLEKPFKLQALLDVVERLIGKADG